MAKKKISDYTGQTSFTGNEKVLIDTWSAYKSGKIDDILWWERQYFDSIINIYHDTPDNPASFSIDYKTFRYKMLWSNTIVFDLNISFTITSWTPNYISFTLPKDIFPLDDTFLGKWDYFDSWTSTHHDQSCYKKGTAKIMTYYSNITTWTFQFPWKLFETL